jgi:two-component system OmpR family sensor kinase
VSRPPSPGPPTPRLRRPGLLNPRPWLSGRTLRTRLGLVSLTLTAAVCVVVGLVSVLGLKLFLEQRLDASLQYAAHRSSLAVGRPAQSFGVPPALAARTGNGQFPNFLFAPGQGQGTLGLQISSDGDTYGGVIGPNGTGQHLTGRQVTELKDVPLDGDPHTVSLGGSVGSYRVMAQVSRQGDTVVTGLPLSQVMSAVYRLAAVITAVSLAALIAAALIGAAIVRRTLRPLSRVAATATQVSELPLDRGEVALAVRVPANAADSRTEVGQVGLALNRMLEHVADALTARQASEARVRRFVADASHELRTPLASIRGYAELTRRSRHEVPGDVARALSRVESEAIRMTGLVEELLMLARLEEGRSARRDPVDLGMLLIDALSDAHAAGPDHRWELQLPDEPMVVIGDESQLHKIVSNLLANAQVHTPAGTVVTARLSVQERPDGDERGSADGGSERDVVLQVVDDGPGIPEQLLPEVFERFVRGDESRSRGTGSTGLGLSIVASITAAHGGRVDVESEPGMTVFTVRLPAAEAEGDENEVEVEPDDEALAGPLTDGVLAEDEALTGG